MKNIVITGSTRGIGYGLTEEFLKRGANVTINGRKAEGLGQALKKLNAYKEHIFGIAGDIAAKDFPEELFNKAKSRFGDVDIWINNAGIVPPYLPTHKIPMDDVNKVFSTNINGLVDATLIVYNKMLVQGHGKIFNMEGLGSDGRMMEKMTVYGTSKRAVQYFTRSFAKEIDSSIVQINVLSPGMVLTDLLMNSLNAGDEKEIERRKKVFNLLAERVEVVSEFLCDGILKSKGNYDRIKYLSKTRVIGRMMRNLFVKRDFFSDEN